MKSSELKKTKKNYAHPVRTVGPRKHCGIKNDIYAILYVIHDVKKQLVLPTAWTINLISPIFTKLRVPGPSSWTEQT